MNKIKCLRVARKPTSSIALLFVLMLWFFAGSAFAQNLPPDTNNRFWTDVIEYLGPNWKAPEVKPNGDGAACTLAGSWTQNAETVGQSTWRISADGVATESGLGRATGTATLREHTLRIDWKTSDNRYSGYYEWYLDQDCRSGKGKLVFSAGNSGSRNSSVRK